MIPPPNSARVRGTQYSSRGLLFSSATPKAADTGTWGTTMAEPAGAGPRPLLGRISLRNLMIAQFAGLVAGAIALLAGLGVWPAVGIGVVAGLIPLIPVGRRVLLDWIG